MEKGKLYTVIGLTGITFNRETGLTINLDGAPVNYTPAKDAILDVVTDAFADVEDFQENGIDMLCEAEYDAEIKEVVLTDVLEVRDEYGFEDTEVYGEDQDEDEPVEAVTITGDPEIDNQ